MDLAEPYYHKWFCKQAVKMQQELIPCIHLSQHQSCGCWHEVDQFSLGSISHCLVC